MNGHSFRGSPHDTIPEVPAIRPALCVMFFKIIIDGDSGVKSTELSRQAHENENTRDWYREKARRARFIIPTGGRPRK